MLPLLLMLLAAPRPDTTATRVFGTVTDSAGRAVRTAQVRVDSLEWNTVSRSGSYSLPTVPGAHLLAVRAVGFEPAEVPVVAGSVRPVRVDVKLARAVFLSEVRVTASAGSRSGAEGTSGFDARRSRAAGGSFLDSADIARRGATRTSDLLRGLPGVALVPVTNALGTSDYVLVMRGTSTAHREVCPIQYYLDGHPFAAEDNIDRLVSPEQIAAIEIYHGASDTPLRYRGPTSRCGVIVIWTKH